MSRIGLPDMPANSQQPSIPYNTMARLVDSLLHLAIEDSLSAPPSTTSSDLGKVWIIGASPTGAWAGKATQLAICVAANSWYFQAPNEGFSAWDKSVGEILDFDGSAWVPRQTGGVSAADVTFDDTDADADADNLQDAVEKALLAKKETYWTIYAAAASVSTGTGLAVWRTPEPGVLTDVIAYVVGAASSGTTQVDVKRDGATIFSSKPTIDAGEYSSATGTAGVILQVPSFFDTNTAYTIDCSQAGTGATGLCVVMRYVPHRVFRNPIIEHTGITWTQSTVYTGIAATSTNMRDSNYTTGAGTDVSAGAVSWVQADLGASKSITKITIAAGGLSGWGGTASYLNGSKLQYYNGSAWADLATLSGFTDSAPQAKDYTFTGLTAQLVRVATAANNSYLALTEFRVYGEA